MDSLIESAACKPQIIAFEINKPPYDALIAAPINRDWMDATQNRFAYRCLPLTIANQSGWIIRSPSSFFARWNGGGQSTDTIVISDEVPPDPTVSTLFGHGVITFNIPWLFRTPAGVNLWVKGPANLPKDGVSALEGIVESDWTASTFTMNWKVTRPDTLIRFERGEPICMIVPVMRGFVESFEPVIRQISSDSEVNAAFLNWSRSRNKFHELVAMRDPHSLRQQWQKDYFQGRDPGTEAFSDHQTKLHTQSFRRDD